MEFRFINDHIAQGGKEDDFSWHTHKINDTHLALRFLVKSEQWVEERNCLDQYVVWDIDLNRTHKAPAVIFLAFSDPKIGTLFQLSGIYTQKEIA